MIRRIIATAALLLGLLAFAPGSAGATTVNLTLARATTGTMINGATQTFTGTAPSSLNHGTVKLVRMVGKTGTPVVVGSAVIHGGTFTVSGGAAGYGWEGWQVVLQNSTGKFVSNWLATVSYGYTFLADLQEVQSNQWDGAAAAAIGGVTYGSSVTGYSTSYVSYADYNLGYHCVALDTWIGLQDRSASGATLAFALQRDGATTGLPTKGIGAASHIIVSTRGTMRVRVQMQGNGNVEGYGAWGNAKILCDRPMA